MKTLIVMPTYNEAQNIEGIIAEVHTHAPQVEVLVVDDSSPDGTAQIVERVAAREPRVRLLMRAGKEGLGKAYLHGFSEALRDSALDRLVMMDADFSHDPAHLPQMLELAQHHDVVIGSRYTRGGATEGWEPWRKALSTGGNLYCRVVTGMPVNDATGGFNMISVPLLRRVNLASLDSSGYAFQMELKYLLWRSGATIVEAPIVFKNRREGESKISNHIITEGIVAPWKMRFKKR